MSQNDECPHNTVLPMKLPSEEEEEPRQPCGFVIVPLHTASSNPSSHLHTIMTVRFIHLDNAVPGRQSTETIDELFGSQSKTPDYWRLATE